MEKRDGFLLLATNLIPLNVSVCIKSKSELGVLPSPMSGSVLK